VLGHLRANGYKTFIATGGSAGFVREYSDSVYGIPREQVAGTAQGPHPQVEYVAPGNLRYGKAARLDNHQHQERRESDISVQR
jgi:hypothetical protein